MKPAHHVIIAGGTGLAVWAGTKSFPAAAACFLSGILIDIDHFADYILATKRVPRRYKEFNQFCAFDKHAKIYLMLHGFEWQFLLWMAVAFLGWPPVWLGVAAGTLTHMIADQWTNPLKPWGYFFFYRLKYGFERKALFTDEYYKYICSYRR